MNLIYVLALTGAGWAALLGLVVVTALVHEAGHAAAWKLVGSQIRELGYATPGRRALRFRVGKLTFAFSPFTLFAYTIVETTEEQYRSMTRTQRVFVHGAGIVANILAAGLGLLVSSTASHVFAVFSASLAIQNIFFQDGKRIFAVLWEL
jgi:hypothetical protein